MQKAQLLYCFLLTFERGTWIIQSPYVMFRTRQKAQNRRSHLLSWCSLLWRLTALCVAILEINIITMLLENLLSSGGCLKQLKLAWHLNLPHVRSMALLPSATQRGSRQWNPSANHPFTSRAAGWVGREEKHLSVFDLPFWRGCCRSVSGNSSQKIVSVH